VEYKEVRSAEDKSWVQIRTGQVSRGDQVQLYFTEWLTLQYRPKMLLIPFYMGSFGCWLGEEL